jgi:methyl-accepting chemotaxis protein
MNSTSWGIGVRDEILWIAQTVASDKWPGLISSFLLFILLLLLGSVFFTTRRRCRILDHASSLIERTGDAVGLQAGLADIQAELHSGASKDDKRLAQAIDEYRETLIEPMRNHGGMLRNSVRPSAFLNLEDLRFDLGSWRVWPGLFVSAGLLFTFLGLIAALAATQQSLEIGSGDQKKMIEALEHLLGVASAKFTMSLTGLFCSIVFTGTHRYFASRLKHAVSRLASGFESKIAFVSLEDLADKQLTAIKDQTTQQQLLNTTLIAELSKPLERITATGTEAIGGMVVDLGRSLTSSIGQSLNQVAERIDGASEKLSSLATSLDEASVRLNGALDQSSTSFERVAKRLEAVVEALTSSAQSVVDSASPIMETARSTAETVRALADGSVQLVDAAKVTVDAERTVVVSSAKSIEELIHNFEARAKAYDGQLENAFTSYVEQVQRTLSELRNHSDGVHDRYAEALQVLQAVIENARAFVPESPAPSSGVEQI